jgi:hypothetical protein
MHEDRKKEAEKDAAADRIRTSMHCSSNIAAKKT